jgi:hypothetical protein
VSLLVNLGDFPSLHYYCYAVVFFILRFYLHPVFIDGAKMGRVWVGMVPWSGTTVVDGWLQSIVQSDGSA